MKKVINNPNQLDFLDALYAVLPPRPQQSTTQALKATTIFTPLPSIVEEGYDRPHNGINWPHYENMLKLFALGYFINREPTEQQKQDEKDLKEAIETVGNAKRKRERLTAEKIIGRNLGKYMLYGRNVIRAMAQPDSMVSERCLKDLRSEIYDTRVKENATQLHKMMSKARTIYMVMQARYHQRED